jgi:hypothetical protein
MVKIIAAILLTSSVAMAGQGGLAPNYSGERYTPHGPPQPYGRDPGLTPQEVYQRILTCQMHVGDPGFARTPADCDRLLALLPRQ